MLSDTLVQSHAPARAVRLAYRIEAQYAAILASPRAPRPSRYPRLARMIRKLARATRTDSADILARLREEFRFA